MRWLQTQDFSSEHTQPLDLRRRPSGCDWSRCVLRPQTARRTYQTWESSPQHTVLAPLWYKVAFLWRSGMPSNLWLATFHALTDLLLQNCLQLSTSRIFVSTLVLASCRIWHKMYSLCNQSKPMKVVKSLYFYLLLSFNSRIKRGDLKLGTRDHT